MPIDDPRTARAAIFADVALQDLERIRFDEEWLPGGVYRRPDVVAREEGRTMEDGPTPASAAVQASAERAARALEALATIVGTEVFRAPVADLRAAVAPFPAPLPTEENAESVWEVAATRKSLALSVEACVEALHAWGVGAEFDRELAAVLEAPPADVAAPAVAVASTRAVWLDASNRLCIDGEPEPVSEPLTGNRSRLVKALLAPSDGREAGDPIRYSKLDSKRRASIAKEGERTRDAFAARGLFEHGDGCLTLGRGFYARQ